MITVLFVTAAVLLLAITFSVIAMSERRSTASSAMTERAIQLADAGSERARRTVVHEFNETFLSIANFLRAVAEGGVDGLAGVKSVMVEDAEVHWQVIDVSDPSAAFGWIDVASTARLGNDAVQTGVRRIGFGASSTFNLAMLSETTDCMFCHLRVNGDVGNLVFMRPGWGSESSGGGNPNNCSGGDGRGSGGSASGLGISTINGNVFAAQNITNDCTDGNRLNGTEVAGVIERYSTNASLPVDLDGDGIADFPPIIREVAMENALGSIAAGNGSCVVGLGGSYDPGACAGSVNLSGAIDGNLVLVGTQANPINIDGDVWVEGDVVISGYVQGLGGLYSGRNVYIAGDVQSADATYRVSGNNCVNEAGSVIMTQAQMTATGFSPNDACARQAIADNTDALRIAARGSIIVGDYTEYDADGDLQSYEKRQSAEFYKQQFDVQGNRRYDRRNGDELRCSGSTCINAEGQQVAGANQVSLDGYDASFRPGHVTAGGGFATWMSDAHYQEILGTEEFTHNNWRWEFDNSDFSNGNNLATVLLNLIDAGLPFDEALSVIDKRVQFRPGGGQTLTSGEFNNFVAAVRAAGYDITDDRHALEQSQGSGQFAATNQRDDQGDRYRYHWSGNSLRVLYYGEREFETQVNRIDAFLYANQRIAGKTSMQALSITGGLVARDLGILAPGRGLERWTYGDALSNQFANERATACSNPNSPDYVYGSEDCALTVNYDHRLRNGGYGYNIIEGRIGITLDWRLADTAADRVNP